MGAIWWKKYAKKTAKNANGNNEAQEKWKKDSQRTNNTTPLYILLSKIYSNKLKKNNN